MFQVYHPVPADISFADVTAYIETLPAIDSPELFGMNENAEKASSELQAEQLIDGVASVQPRFAQNLVR